MIRRQLSTQTTQNSTTTEQSLLSKNAIINRRWPITNTRFQLTNTTSTAKSVALYSSPDLDTLMTPSTHCPILLTVYRRQHSAIFGEEKPGKKTGTTKMHSLIL